MQTFVKKEPKSLSIFLDYGTDPKTWGRKSMRKESVLNANLSGNNLFKLHLIFSSVSSRQNF
jgi:hypothetical protein